MFATLSVRVSNSKIPFVKPQFDTYPNTPLQEALSKVLASHDFSLEQPRFADAKICCEVSKTSDFKNIVNVNNLTLDLELHSVLNRSPYKVCNHSGQAEASEAG